MIKFLFLTVPNQCTYDQLKTPLKFKEDIYGVSTWTMKHPLTIFSSDLKFRHSFKQNDVKIQPVHSPPLQQKWKYFVITKGDGGKYYCTSQIIYEKGLLKTSISHTESQFFATTALTSTQQFYLPRCIVMISELPYFKLQVNLLKIHKELKKTQPAISCCIQDDLYQIYLEYLETGRQKEWEGLNLQQIHCQRKSYCPIQLCFAYYVQCCNNHNSGQCIYIQKASNREVLHLYKLNTSTLYQIGYFFHLPFSPFSLRKIISAILTQKQLIFCSSNNNLTVMVIQTLMQMILPLKWCYMYAPNLPVQLLQAAQQSFMPFIVGISKQCLPLITKTNKIIIHIDTDQIDINYDQQQEQLNLLSKRFQSFLSWKTNSNKYYLEWEKQLRINSILMITTIFKKDFSTIHQRYSSTNDFTSEEEKRSEHKFYQQFLSKSMMYRKLIEDVHQNVYSQFYKLTKMDFNERKIFLQNKFNTLHSQTIYPTKCDNKKKWIKFYEKQLRNKRKTRLNRHSLSMVQHNLISMGNHSMNNQPFYGSNVSLNNLNSNHRIDNNATYQNTSFSSRMGNHRNNELYQSTISSLSSQPSTLRFNAQQSQRILNSSSKNIILNQNNENLNLNRISTPKQINNLNQQKIEGNNKTNSFYHKNTDSSNNKIISTQKTVQTNIKSLPINHQSINQNNSPILNPNYRNIPIRESFIQTNNALNQNFHSASQKNNNSTIVNNFQNKTNYQTNQTAQNHVNANQRSKIMINQINSGIINKTTHSSYIFPNNNQVFVHNMNLNSNNTGLKSIQNANKNKFNNFNNPLNQSMVTNLMSPNSYNVNGYKAMGTLNSINSHRNLNTTQSTVAL